MRERFESWARKNPNVKIKTSIFAGHAINENMVRLLLATEAGWARLSLSIPIDNWKYDYHYKIWKGHKDQVR